MTHKKEKKTLSMRRKFLFIFGTFIFVTSFALAVFAIRVARHAVTEKVETHLIDKATDTAEIIDGRVEAMFQFIENIADISMIISENVSISEKLAYFKKITTNRKEFTSINIADCDGNLYLPGKTINVSKQNWYPIVMSGERFISEPFISAANGQLIIVIAIPTYDESRKINGALNVAVDGLWLSKQIDNIVVGKTGACSILGLKGTTIAHKNPEFVEKQENIFETVKSNPAFKSLAEFCNNAITLKESSVGFYDLFGEKTISSFAKMKSTGWTIIISAPTDEFMGTIESLRNRMLIVGLSILTVNLIILFFIVRTMVKPINVVVNALKDIAQGDGDLTVRLPLVGSQEIINLSKFFNKTIEKIGFAVKTVGENSQTMENIGTELASNMTETASAVQQISANIDDVKQQTLTQAASVTETAATVEEIIRTIKQLNSSIETQAASVAESSSAIEQMVGNIASITQTLDKTNDVVKNLASATADGKHTITTSNTVTQKIAEESGGLLEASNVIQHIASQTNLLAMNAAIEAAHAGERQ